MADRRSVPARMTAEQAKKLLFAAFDNERSDAEDLTTSDEEDTNENLASASHISSDVDSGTSA